jgi:hypothetical protein
MIFHPTRPLSSSTKSILLNLSFLNFSISSCSYFYPNYLYISSKVVKGYLLASVNESIPKSLFSFPRVTIELVFLYDAVFSIMPNGFPGITSVAFIKEEPKSKPIRSA